MKKLICVLLSVVILTVCTACTKQEEYTDVLAKATGEYRVRICGFMSPVLSDSSNYFYLTETPYCMPQDGDTLQVYLKLNDKAPVQVAYTNQYIEVEGDLLVAPAPNYRDAQGNVSDRRIINATYRVLSDVENPSIERYNNLAETGIYEDLYMYYGMLDAIIRQGIDESEIVEIREEEFSNMVLMLASSGITDEGLVYIIDRELGLIKRVNEKIRAEDYDFRDCIERADELEFLLKDYFKKVIEDVEE